VRLERSLPRAKMNDLVATLEYQADAGTLLTAARSAIEERQTALREQLASTIYHALDQGMHPGFAGSNLRVASDGPVSCIIVIRDPLASARIFPATPLPSCGHNIVEIPL
jgi:hypothetical protein